jgi:hypothetical protein
MPQSEWKNAHAVGKGKRLPWYRHNLRKASRIDRNDYVNARLPLCRVRERLVRRGEHVVPSPHVPAEMLEIPLRLDGADNLRSAMVNR